MELITPFDFVEQFESRQSVAVVGNAPTLTDSGAGAWIDSHDVVVRFNDCRVRGFEHDIGSRTDILISNPYAETRPGSRLDDLFPPLVVVVITPQTRRGDKAEFARWVGANRVLFTYSPDIRISTVDRSEIALTTGTYGISLVTRLLKPKRLSVTGFTMFAPGQDFYYWDSKPAPGLQSHAPATEAHVLIDLLNSLKSSILATQDIFDVAARSGKALDRHVRLHPLKSDK